MAPLALIKQASGRAASLANPIEPHGPSLARGASAKRAIGAVAAGEPGRICIAAIVAAWPHAAKVKFSRAQMRLRLRVAKVIGRIDALIEGPAGALVVEAPRQGAGM